VAGRRASDNFNVANIVKIYKRNDKSIGGNYRGILLLVSAGKLLFKMVNIVESVTSQSQAGFRSGKSTADRVFTLRQLEIPQAAHRTSCRLVDLKKAFDTVDKEIL